MYIYQELPTVLLSFHCNPVITWNQQNLRHKPLLPIEHFEWQQNHLRHVYCLFRKYTYTCGRCYKSTISCMFWYLFFYCFISGYNKIQGWRFRHWGQLTVIKTILKHFLRYSFGRYSFASSLFNNTNCLVKRNHSQLIFLYTYLNLMVINI